MASGERRESQPAPKKITFIFLAIEMIHQNQYLSSCSPLDNHGRMSEGAILPQNSSLTSDNFW